MMISPVHVEMNELLQLLWWCLAILQKDPKHIKDSIFLIIITEYLN